MVSVFDFENYRAFLKQRIREMPKRGYGQFRKLSNYIGVHSTLISQIFHGTKTLSPEQAAGTCEFLGLTDLEAEYFLLLVQWDRAGNLSLKKILRKQLDALKKRALELVYRVQVKQILTEEQKAVFYSDWIYSAIWQMTAISSYGGIDLIAQALDLPKKKVKEAVDFLLSMGMCKTVKGKLKNGPTSVHLESFSPWIRSHHMNWRQKAMEGLHEEEAAKLHYTCPLTLSKSDALKLRDLIVKFIEQVNKVVDPSPSEELHCLNIDWFKIDK